MRTAAGRRRVAKGEEVFVFLFSYMNVGILTDTPNKREGTGKRNRESVCVHNKVALSF